jgi:uncharacterized protein
MTRPLELRDDDVGAWVASLGLPGMVDAHVHFMPESVQAKVWAHFERLDPPWAIRYRGGEAERLAALARFGVRHHTDLAYPHRPGMAAWLNRHTLALAQAHPQVVASFTLYPEPEVEAYVSDALDAGGACAKVHLQVGKFHLDDPRLGGAWALLEQRQVPVVLHAGAVRDGSGGEEFCGVAPVARLLDRHPGLRLVIAHLGVPEPTAFLDLVASAPGLAVDTAMVFGRPVLGGFPDRLAGRLAELGDRVVFGSDFPTLPYPFADQLAGLANLGLGDGWLRAVLWDNGVRLFQLDRPAAGSPNA